MNWDFGGLLRYKAYFFTIFGFEGHLRRLLHCLMRIEFNRLLRHAASYPIKGMLFGVVLSNTKWLKYATIMLPRARLCSSELIEELRQINPSNTTNTMAKSML